MFGKRRPERSIELAEQLAAHALANLRADHAGEECGRTHRPCRVHTAIWSDPEVRADNARWYIRRQAARNRSVPQIVYDFAREPLSTVERKWLQQTRQVITRRLRRDPAKELD